MLCSKILANGLGSSARCHPVPARSKTNLPRATARFAGRDSNQAYGSWDYDEGGMGHGPGKAELPASMTASLLQAAQSLILYTIEAKSNLKDQLNDQEQDSKQDSDKELSILAAAAVSTAEANGALPPMSQSQRKSIEQTLCKVASSMSRQGLDRAHATGRHPGVEAGEGEDMSMEILRGGINGPYLAPELPELLQELSTLELFRGWGEQGNKGSGDEQVQDGLGNISLPRRQHLKPSNIGDPSSSVNAPAMGRTERTELEAEGDYMALEVDDFEPHANAVNEHTSEAEHVVDGDAPAAGDGMQVGTQNSTGAPGKQEEVSRSKMMRRDRPAAADF